MSGASEAIEEPEEPEEPKEESEEPRMAGEPIVHDAATGRNEVMRREDHVAREDPAMATPAGVGHEAEHWPDVGDLRQRFAALQSEFIDDPKGAVTKADGLINDVVERLTTWMHEQVGAMHRGVEGTSDTEQLRQMMRGYRDLVDWIDTRRAA